MESNQMADERNKGCEKKKQQRLSLKRKGKKGFNTVNYRDWKRLPEGVIDLIAQSLPVVDCVPFSNVCNSWKSVMAEAFPHKQTRGFPWLVMSTCTTTNKTRTCFSILEKKVRCIEVSDNSSGYVWGSFQHWLIMVKPGTVKPLRHEICLLNLFSSTEVVLPKMNHYHRKLLISGPPSEKSSIFMLVGRIIAEFALWIPGLEEWVEHKVDTDQILDAVFFNGNFYLLTIKYKIVVVDAAQAFSAVKTQGSAAHIETQIYQIKISDMPDLASVLNYLVESSGEILLVRRLFKTIGSYIRVTHAFEVFKLDLSQMAWVKLHDLGGRVLFVGRNCFISISAAELGDENVMGNCIFFTNDYKLWFYNQWDAGHEHDNDSEIDDWGIFSLNGHGPRNFSYRDKKRKCHPLWISAPLWWYCQGYTMIGGVSFLRERH